MIGWSAESPEQAQLHSEMTISLLQRLGWVINFKKSDLIPSEDFQFLGMHFNTRQFTVAPLPKMRLKVQSVHQHWMTNPIIKANDLHRLLGMMVFMATLVRRGRWRLWPVQWWAATTWCQKTGNWTEDHSSPVAWWGSPAVLQGLPLATQETEVTLFTDASNSGWGAQLGSRSIQGQWSASLRSSHINVLEMQVVINTVRGSLPHLRSRVVRLMCNNTVTVAYIKNEGGTRSNTLMQLTIPLLKWCNCKAIRLVPVHLPGVRNRNASLPAVKSTCVETLWAILLAKGHSREAADMMSRSLRQLSLQVYELHQGRFMHFCWTKRWQVFNVRSDHFSTYRISCIYSETDCFHRPSSHIARQWRLCCVTGSTILQRIHTSSCSSGHSGCKDLCNAELCLSGIYI